MTLSPWTRTYLAHQWPDLDAIPEGDDVFSAHPIYYPPGAEPMTHAIYLNGHPDNLEAAASDALDWLRYFECHVQAQGQFQGEDLRRLERAIAALEQHLPQEGPEFRETQAGTPFVATAYEYGDGELRRPEQEAQAT